MREATTTGRKDSAGYIGERRKRVEDVPLLVGAGQYVSDLHLDGMAYLSIVRSPHPHARIIKVVTEPARAIPGVIAAFSANDLPEILKPLPGTPRDPGGRFVTPTPLAADVARFVGEPVAVVVAEDAYAAADGAEAVIVEYEELPVVVSVEQDPATTPILHAGWSSNVAETIQVLAGEGAQALHRAPVIVEEAFSIGRVSAQSMEPRAVIAVYDTAEGQLTVYLATQSVNLAHASLSALLGLSKDRVRVIAPDIGGAFGVKTRLYGEEVLAAHLAMRLERPMRWVGDRREEFISTNHGRAQLHHVRMGFDEDGHIMAFVDNFKQDAGAYNITASAPAFNAAVSMHGPYRIPHLEITGDVVLTNTMPTGPYRGAGRPEGAYIMERMLDRAAGVLKIDRVELRRRNLIQPTELPYDTGMKRQDRTITFDVGDYPAGFEQVLQAIGYERFREQQRVARERGIYLGIGVANCLEMSGIGQGDSVRVRIDPGGDVWVMCAVSQMGQGHPTAYAQIAAERLGAPIERVRVIESDSSLGLEGAGTFASRSTVAVGNAIAHAALQVRQRLFNAAARYLGADPKDLEWSGDKIMVRGATHRYVPYWRIATEAGNDGIEEMAKSQGLTTFGFQGHGVIVSVDPDLLTVKIHDYVICHDAGVIVNPLLADGQTIGSAVQGLGNVMLEEMLYDTHGYPLTTSFHRYVLPGSIDTPEYRIFEQHFPAQTNPEGFRGLGEGGTIASLPALAQAIEDALSPFGVRLNSLPLTPQRLHEALLQTTGLLTIEGGAV
jgi:aerobic carbon-monoxide dehydrogenase large subunit